MKFSCMTCYNMDDKPEKPDESRCCGSGCNPCIFDVYEEQMKKWESNQTYSTNLSTVLSETEYLPFLVANIEEVTSQIRIFEFQPVKLLTSHENDILISNAQTNVDYKKIVIDNLNLRANHYLIMKGQYETIEDNVPVMHNISRSYTPVLADSNKGKIKIIVVIYPNGKMSTFLGKLILNDIVFWRGPYNEFKYGTNSYEKLFLIGGGTGIIPLYNTAKEIVENDAEETIVKCVASFKNLDSFILREELRSLQQYWNFQLKTCITDQQNVDFTLKYNENVIFSKLTKDVIFEELSFYKPGKCLVVICGPPSFNSFVSENVLNFGVIKENIYVYK